MKILFFFASVTFRIKKDKFCQKDKIFEHNLYILDCFIIKKEFIHEIEINSPSFNHFVGINQIL